MKPKLYLDTSVFGGYFDKEFSEHTVPLFNRIKNGEYFLLYSAVTQDELENAPQNVKDLPNIIDPSHKDFLVPTTEEVVLAKKYIEEKAVGKTSYADCLHIALATVHKADYLVSWNFKHIVNVQRIQNYNSINLKNGYKFLEIRSPREFAYYGDD
ncbi:MAG: PIN domain-containing protein [Fibromonadales bacterium]|nr:PIN domain-containing protein [Fibromonadales bacterium]